MQSPGRPQPHRQDDPPVRDPSESRVRRMSQGADPYADVVGRRSVDHMLSNAHQQLAVLSNQADFKANILITVCTIALSIVVTRLDDADLRWSLITLSVFLLVALLCAVVAVVPKFSTLRSRRPPPPVGFDPLFFGHFARLPQQQYVDEMAVVLREDSSV